jgi:glutamate 5-kinase
MRQLHLGKAKRIVIKVGSSLLAASPVGQPAAIADDLAQLSARGIETVIVSSGAIALGFGVLGFDKRPHDLPSLQAAAAIGQGRLLKNWEHAFSAHGKHIAQILLTHDDLANRSRFLNSRHALRALLDAGVIPVINENDTVATEEIKYGDNDLLAALVCNLVSADALVIYTDVDGLHDAHPSKGGVRIPLVTDIEAEARPHADASSHLASGLGSGGMASKILAAQKAARFGVATVVLAGAQPGVLRRALDGEDVGTLFVPLSDTIGSRKHWLAYGGRANGELIVDSGAHRAISTEGKSLLPAGLLEVRGDFELGALIAIVCPEKGEFARGLVSYSAQDLRKLCGCRSSDIEARLGYKHIDEIVHRNDLVLLTK